MSGILELDDVASRALASIILERTADTLLDGGNNAAVALEALNADTGLVPDVCAAILTATAWLAGAGGLQPEAIYASALAHQPDQDEAPPEAPTEPLEAPAEGPADDDTGNGPETPTEPSEGQSGETADSAGESDDDYAARLAREATMAAQAAMAKLGLGNDDAPES